MPGSEKPLTLADLGEQGILDAIAPVLPTRSELVELGTGDDCAVLRAPDGRVVISTDLLVEGHDFRLDWSSGRDVGIKAAGQNLADIAAMGARPTGMVVGLAAPPATAVAWVVDLAAGLASGCAGTGAVVVGGDLSAAESISVSVTVLGDLAGRPAVTRAGARPGDRVVLAGVLGRAAAGLALLRAGLGDHAPDLVAAQLRPRPPVRFGPVLAGAGATAMIDLSDALLRDGGRVAAASGVDLRFDGRALSRHLSALRPAARLLAGRAGVEQRSGADQLAWNWVLAGGEDHGLLACLPPESEVPQGCVVIGEVGEGPGRVMVDQADVPNTVGWDHFRLSG